LSNFFAVGSVEVIPGGPRKALGFNHIIPRLHWKKPTSNLLPSIHLMLALVLDTIGDPVLGRHVLYTSTVQWGDTQVKSPNYAIIGLAGQVNRIANSS